MADLNRALAHLVALAPQDGKPVPQKHEKQFDEKLLSFVSLAKASRDAALHALVKSFEMLSPRKSPNGDSLFFTVAERVFLALHVSRDIGNLRAALASIPGGDVLAASPGKAQLPEQMMHALTLAVCADQPGGPSGPVMVPQDHIDALLTRVTGGPASEKTADWLRGMTEGLCRGAYQESFNNIPLWTWAGETLRTLSGEQIAGMASAFMRIREEDSSLGTTLWERLRLSNLTAPQLGAVGVAAGKTLPWVSTTAIPILGPLIEPLDLRRTAFVCGLAAQLPPERRDHMVAHYASGHTTDWHSRERPSTQQVTAFRLAVTLAGDPFVEFATAEGDEGRLERLTIVLQIPGVARLEHARRLAELVSGGVIPLDRAEAMADRISPAFSVELRRLLLEANGQALLQCFADASAKLDGALDPARIPVANTADPESEASPEDRALPQFEAAVAWLDDAIIAYAQRAGLTPYVGSPRQPTAFTAPPVRQELLAMHLAALQGLVNTLRSAVGRIPGSVLHAGLKQLAVARLSSYIAALRRLPEAAGLAPLAPVSFVQPQANTEPERDVKASGPARSIPLSDQPTSQVSGAAVAQAARSGVRSLDDDENER